MQDVFRPLQPADYAFVVGLIENPISLIDDGKLKRLAAAHEADPDDAATREALDRELEGAIRFLGSSDFAFAARYAFGFEPGVSFRTVVRDAARALKVRFDELGTDREMLEAFVEAYVTQEFARLTPAQQQQMLTDLGVEQERAAAFLKRSAGVFALPVMIQAFGTIVVDGLIKGVIFGTIARFIGKQLAMRLFKLIAGRFPWWLRWIGPAAWTLSIGWTAIDLQGPALRKTIPICLYLGLCSVRERTAAA